MNNNKKKSTNVSSRLDTELYIALVNDAETKGISLNSLINSIIKRHLLWDRFAEEMGLIPLTKRTLKKIFRTMDEEDIRKIAREVGGTVPQELIYLSYDTFDFPNLMKMIEISDSRFGKVNAHVKDTRYSINILHGVCENFSKFLAETHQALADNLGLKFDIEHSDNSMICMGFEKPSDSKSNGKF
jgi:hypothetical protein